VPAGARAAARPASWCATGTSKAREFIVVRHNLDTLDRRVVPWLEASEEQMAVTVTGLPQREHIDVPVREQLIVELYSK
jgi:small subunit ribosomal protein S4